MKLISLNIEGHKHLHQRVLPFLIEQQPDVVCLQEVFAVDVPELMATLKMDGQFQVMADVTEVNVHQAHALGEWGVVQLSRFPITALNHHYYFRLPCDLPIFYKNNDPNGMNRVFAWMTVTVDGQSYTIGTTHFTWSVNGASTPEQLRDLDALLKIIDDIPDIVFCGDFNAPRGLETFQRIAARYTDHIPPEITTSIDGQLHKAGNLELMVDGLFSTPQYQISNVQVVSGLSDHKGVVAEIKRVEQLG